MNNLYRCDLKKDLAARTCPICECPATLPRRSYDARGNPIAGCVHPCHDAHIQQNELIDVRTARIGIVAHILEASNTDGA